MSSLGSTIGELKTKVDAQPTDYVKSEEIGKVMTEYFQEARIYSSTVMAKIPESLTERIDGLKKAFTDTKAGIDEGLAGIKPKKPLFSLSIGNKFLLVLAEVMLISAAIGIIVFVNIPMFLVNEVYLQHIYGDYRAPGWYYQDAYTKIKAGKRKEVKVQIKNANTFLASFKEEETVLGPLVGEDIYITKIQYGNCATNW